MGPALNIVLAKTGFECDKIIGQSTAYNVDVWRNVGDLHRISELCLEEGGKNV